MTLGLSMSCTIDRAIESNDKALVLYNWLTPSPADDSSTFSQHAPKTILHRSGALATKYLLRGCARFASSNAVQ